MPRQRPGARRRTTGAAPYHRAVPLSPVFLLLALVVALIVLVPARRLTLAGFGGRTVGAYAISLWLLAMVVAIRPGVLRILIPILLVAYLAPFVASPEAVGRILRRGGSIGRGPGAPPTDGRPPIKNVTPPDDPSAG
jgi:hypothetical protein